MTKNTSKHTESLKIPKLILQTSKFIAYFSSKLVTLFAAKLFTSPIKHKIPKRELEMYSKSSKKILLVHGWSGRGTQLFKIADELVKTGYSTISFDAPAHGKSPEK